MESQALSYIKKAIIFFCCVCFLNILFFQSSHSALAATNLSSCTTFNRSLAPDDKDSTTGGLVSKLQWFLVYNGYLLTTPTGHYGPATIAAVQKFQNKYGIVSDGILGAATEEKIQDLSCFSNAVLPLNLPTNTTDTSSNSNSKTCVVLSRSLGPNDKDSTTGGVLLGLVSKLQQFLIHQGYLKAASTGNFGPATVAAVQNFQKDNKIVSSGSPSTTGYGAVGKLTRTTIENISCNQSGGSSLLPTGISSLPLPCTPPALFNYQTGISCLLATSTATTATTTQIYIGGGYSGGGGGGGSSVQLPGIPSGPTNLGAVSNTIGQVTVSWTNTANNQSGFNVYRSTNEGATFSSIGTANANDTSYTDTTATPGVKYMYRVSATNIGGESTPMYYISANALANFQANTHPEPTRVGWTLGGPSFQSSAPTGVVTIDSTRPGSVFYPGEPLFFYLNSAQYAPGGYAKTYEVRNYDGAIVDSGPVVDGKDLTLNSEPLGWYKLYLFGSATTAQNGDQIGDTTFSIIRPNTNFPSTDDMYVTGGYNAGYKFIKDHIQVDQTINFPGWAGGPNPVDGSTPFISDPNTPDPATYKNTLFTVKWTGQIQAPTTDTYTFSLNSSVDIGRIVINGIALVNSVNGFGEGSGGNGSITLQAGHRYDIQVEYAHDDHRFYPAAVALTWSNSTMTTTVVPQSALYSSASAPSPNGLTAEYYKILEYPDQNDETMRGVAGIGPNRYEVDVTSPGALAASTSTLEGELATDVAIYTGKDTQRSRPLLISFGPGTEGHQAEIAEVVREFKDRVKYYEPENEPNGSYSGSDFVPVMQRFYNTVKGVDSSLKVIGPGIVCIGPGYCLDWTDAFFAAGGGNYIDAFSFHAYNATNGDFLIGQKSFDGLNAILNKYGLGNIEKWQTEQGFMSATFGEFTPHRGGRWTMAEFMVFEQNGLPKEHNVLWYDTSHGFDSFPVWWESTPETLEPEIPMVNTWSQELFGTNYVSKYDFGTTSDETYLGSLFTGPSKSVAVFMSNGATDGKVNLSVNSGSSLHIVDVWGNPSDIPVTNGIAVLPVPENPVYVELAPGQTISVIKDNWGPDLALQPGTTATASGTYDSSISKLIDGNLENWYYAQGGSPTPWMASSTSPTTVEIDLASSTSIDRVVVHAPNPWQSQGTLLDYYLQYYDATSSAWINLDHVQEDPRTFGSWSSTEYTTVDSYTSDRSIFFHHFPSVTTSKIRLVVNDETWGGDATEKAWESGGQPGPHQVTLQEIEIYGQ